MKVACPACRKETDWDKNPFRPFCSKECKERDLGNWATERYRFPAEQEDKDTGNKKNGDGEPD